jgi:inosose dehydratase
VRASRRELLAGLAGLAVVRPSRALAAQATPALANPFAPRVGYAAITWNGNDRQAITDVAAVGFHGIQLRASVLKEFEDKPAELRHLLDENGIKLLCFSSGSVDAAPEKRAEYLETHTRHAKFVAALGGPFIQLISNRPQDRAPTSEEYARLGGLLNDIGRRTLDQGVRLVYHNHMHAFSETPEEVARVLEQSDARYLSLLFDTAHYAQGGGDPAQGLRRHRDRLAVVHLKDVVSPLPGATGDLRYSYKFVELGRGKVDVPAAIGALREIGYKGDVIVELDAPPEPEKTPKDCAILNKAYVTGKLGLAL